ncbi:MAG TPA: hypothetical protein VM262_19535 [Acidimicrobiales bacterium]|nr:hypothetical protein [Acidimicrobiales bacterium]
MLIAAESTENVFFPFTANVDTATITCEVAIVRDGARPSEADDDEAGDWHATEIVDGEAVLLIGPDGGALALKPGVYGMWVRIRDHDEVPVERVGVLTVY